MSRWINPADDTIAVAGSVYVTPVFSSGPENGLAIRTAPVSLHETAGQGVAARTLNYFRFQEGDDRMKADQHMAMRFRGSGSWAPTCGAVARSNYGFLIGSTTSVSVTRDAVSTHQLVAFVAAVGVETVVHDDGFHVAGFERNAGGQARFASSSTVSSTAFTGATFPLAALTIGANSFFLATSGTGLLAWTYSGTGLLPTATSAGTPGGVSMNSSSAAMWGTSQAFAGSLTATGPGLFYTKGATTFQYYLTPDGISVANTPWVSPPANTLADIGYDDYQGVFVAAFHSSTGGRVQFATSSDGLIWTNSSTAQGPANLQVPSGATTGTVAFKICAGVWFLVITSNAPPNFVYGSSAASGLRTFGFYSLDFGVTWYPADLDMATASSGATIRIKNGPDRFMVMHDSDVAISGRLGYPEAIA
jgi:hypothetical protein